MNDGKGDGNMGLTEMIFRARLRQLKTNLEGIQRSM
ncbi:MAG: hypothetical protein CHKLHMKO_00649 [Candidatus Argoarchaeum ethanivorans]|uniref:Uncharacterized protein n=1 Tax=Candidatus Argoarchaeum ethanivorans TaxID=2608793 RepID=A0A811THC9_9EURY|nr:MAG: hypothetical protein CHKLHMKO_00649 [Candidatus Argoarchaeum ethanivorans]